MQEIQMKYSVAVQKLPGGRDPLIRANWCEEHIGKRNEMWRVNSEPYKSLSDVRNRKTATFLFVNEHDATLFALRWIGSTV